MSHCSRRRIVAIVGMSAVLVVAALAGCTSPVSPPAPAPPRQSSSPSSSVLVLEARVLGVSKGTATVSLALRNTSDTTVTFTPSQAVCRLTARRADQSIAATGDFPLRFEPTAGGGPSSSTPLSIESGDPLSGMAEFRLPGPGEYTVDAAMVAVPGVGTSAGKAVVR